jgi:hypothetical protein
MCNSLIAQRFIANPISRLRDERPILVKLGIDFPSQRKDNLQFRGDRIAIAARLSVSSLTASSLGIPSPGEAANKQKRKVYGSTRKKDGSGQEGRGRGRSLKKG